MGISSVAELNKYIPAGHRPDDILVGAKSVIVFAGHMTFKGAWRSPDDRTQYYNRDFPRVHIGIAKRILAGPNVDPKRRDDIVAMIREVMQTDHKTYIYHLPLPSRDPVYARYPLEDEAGALHAAHRQYREILERPRKHLPKDLQRDIAARIPGVLQECLTY